jgi:hypothetical protein
MNLSPQEITWLYLWLEEHQKKMPGGRSRRPHYNATSWDLDDLFRAFRVDAVWSREIVWKAVSERAAAGAWPKMEPSHSFWLMQRWEMASRYCCAVLEKASKEDSSPIIAASPVDAQAAIKWLLLDLWDGRLVDLWIRENARDCVAVDWPESGEEPYLLEQYLKKRGMS